jgi:hypothetical protein
MDVRWTCLGNRFRADCFHCAEIRLRRIRPRQPGGGRTAGSGAWRPAVSGLHGAARENPLRCVRRPLTPGIRTKCS